jgi:hypothetical protein
LEDIGADERIILKWILEGIRHEDVELIQLAQDIIR